MSDWPHDLLETYSAVDPNFPRVIAGATPEQIESLVELSGETLHGDYRLFLEHFGQNDHRILGVLDGRYLIEDILGGYRENADFPEDRLKPGWLEVFYGNFGMNLMMDSSSSRVHMIEGYDDLDWFAESWSKLFQQKAFDRFRIYNADREIFSGTVERAGPSRNWARRPGQ